MTSSPTARRSCSRRSTSRRQISSPTASSLIDGGRVAADGRIEELKAAVGGTRIDLRFDVPADAATAVGVLVGDGALVGPDGRTVALASDGSAAEVHGVLERLAAVELEPLTIDQRRPTLDDVFFAVTRGHS